MIPVLPKGEIRCVKNVSTISQFKIPSCEKNATPFGFTRICLFINTIFKDDNTPVICIHGPAYGDSLVIAGVRCWTITF